MAQLVLLVEEVEEDTLMVHQVALVAVVLDGMATQVQEHLELVDKEILVAMEA
jgi:hypothetical protein